MVANENTSNDEVASVSPDQASGGDSTKTKRRRFKLFRRSKSKKIKEELSSPVATVPVKKEQPELLCMICFYWKPAAMFPTLLTCEHKTCIDCLRQHLTIAIKEWRMMVSCPECSELFHPLDVKEILNDDALFRKYEEFALRRVLAAIPDIRWCPAPDCSFAVIAAGCASCPQLKCERPGCKTEFCYHCRQLWHPNTTCDAARLRNSVEVRSLSTTDRSASGCAEDMKPCPRCGALIIKMDDGSCNHITCVVCGAEFCWLCMKEISDLHYLSPSGCTFWGKKPWSRKKKIVWQIGTLIGAPVGIALAAGVVLPAMMIGIPVYIGREIKQRFTPGSSVHKRNIAITIGVASSLLVSPFLAALTVGVGVPIALGYVYGVVPVSLCRSGGCAGVSTSRNGRGVNLDFAERDEVYTAASSQSAKSSPTRATSPGSQDTNSSLQTNHDIVVSVQATVTNEPQLSMSGSQDSTSIESRSLIAHFRCHGDCDVDSHASLIPQPRSTTVSVTSSLENVSGSTTAQVSGSNHPCTSLPEVSCESGHVDATQPSADEWASAPKPQCADDSSQSSVVCATVHVPSVVASV